MKRRSRREKPPQVMRLEVEYVLAERSQREQAIAIFASLCRRPMIEVEKNGTFSEHNEGIRLPLSRS